MEMIADRAELEYGAWKFRKSLESYYRNNPEVNHSTNYFNIDRGKFPLDHCKAASFMFGHYLLKFCNANRDRLFYVWGVRDEETHGWIQYEQWFVDLTADQFEDEIREVIVANAEKSPWHQTFKGHSKRKIYLEQDDELKLVSEEIGRSIRKSAK